MSVLSNRPSHGFTSAPMLRRALRAGSLALTLMAFLLVTVFTGVAPASAYWKSAGVSSSTAATGTLLAPTNVTAGAPSAGSRSVAVTWTASAGTLRPSGYIVTRTSGGITVAACGSSATTPVTTTTCTDTNVPDGTHTYTVTAAFRSWTARSGASAPVAVTTPTATSLVFLTAPVTGSASETANLGPISVQLRDASGTPMPAPSGGTVVTLTSSSPGPKVFSLTAGGAAVTSVTIPAGSTAATFYYGDSRAGTPTITAQTGLLTASQTATVTATAGVQLAFSSAMANGAATNPSLATVGPITLQFQDRFGNPAVASSNIVITLSSDSKNVPVFSTAYAGATTTTVTILAGTTSIAFYHGDTKAGAPEITATSGTMTAKQKVSFSSPNSGNLVVATTTNTSTARSAPAPTTVDPVVATPTETVVAEPAPAPAPAPAPEPVPAIEPAPAPAPAPAELPATEPTTEPEVALAPSEPLVSTEPSSESTGS
jgi:hypothetical protein